MVFLRILHAWPVVPDLFPIAVKISYDWLILLSIGPQALGNGRRARGNGRHMGRHMVFHEHVLCVCKRCRLWGRIVRDVSAIHQTCSINYMVFVKKGF